MSTTPENTGSGPQGFSHSKGLTSEAARLRLAKDGTNTMPDASVHVLRNIISKFWAPVPWLLEAAIVLQVVLHKYLEASTISGLLVFNAALAYLQESRAQATLLALKSSLALNASVQRDGVWKIIPAADLVKGDLVKLSLGGVVAADVHLINGSVLLDQSLLTGESLPIEAGAGVDTYAGTLVRRGEATALVTATGIKTKFGKTAELVRNSRVTSSQQNAVFKIVRNLALFNGLMVLLIGLYAWTHAMPWSEIIPLLLTCVLASIPVALPVTFTLAAALGANALAKVGVLPTRLSAVDEAATIDVLCSDKTGTLTSNTLSVISVKTLSDIDEAHLLALASLASAEGGDDSVDAAVRIAAVKKPISDQFNLVSFVPFDPAKKISEATFKNSNGKVEKVIKGAFTVVADLTAPPPNASLLAAELEKQGFRVLAVAAGSSNALQLIGLIALSDRPRVDSASLITELHYLGVNTVMVTGDAPATAESVAKAVGLTGATCPSGPLPVGLASKDFSVFANILPEGKYNLVKAFQKNGHAVGMCGDGANDAPALRQAQIGIAVSTATDVAKSAAGVVLTSAGLAGIVSAVKEGRITFQRILTYIINSVLKKIVQVLLLAFGLVMTGHAVLTPMLMLILMISGDFLAMSLTTDRVSPSLTPNSWQTGRITIAGVILGSCFLVFCLIVLAVGKFKMGYNLEELRTISVVSIVFGSQATIYAIRERRHLWGLRPTVWLVLSSGVDILIISVLAIQGIAMTSIKTSVVAMEFAGAIVFGLLLNMIKIPLFARLKIS